MPQPMTRPEFYAAVAAAEPGDLIVYHTGSLMFDRLAGPHFPEVNCTALAAWEKVETGEVILIQRYVRPGVFDYMAKKQAAPFKPVEWQGCYNVEVTVKRTRVDNHGAVVPAVVRRRGPRKTRLFPRVNPAPDHVPAAGLQDAA